ncbi:MAG: DNA polymerase IV [Candidatus Omnitrophota bacterium]
MKPKMGPKWKRKILHVDMDAFFAAIEVRDNPSLKGKPVIVGGDPYGRGVVSTASYEARKFGVHSAMSSAAARRLCPQGIFLRPSFHKYEEASERIQSILRQHTDLVEPLSLDEAYLDVTEHRLGVEDPVLVAKLIKQNIFAVTHLTASAGVAPNKFLAKVASDMNKPNGLTVVTPHQVADFVLDLPVRKIPGVGPVTERELAAEKIFFCRDLQRAGRDFLASRFGKFGWALYERGLGRDDSSVIAEWTPKQLSSEETFAKDTKDVEFLKGQLAQDAQRVWMDLKTRDLEGKTVVLKLKYFDFELITRSQTLEDFPESWQEIHQTACRLLEHKTNAGRRPVRLIGLGISGLSEIGSVRKKSLPADLFR